MTTHQTLLTTVLPSGRIRSVTLTVEGDDHLPAADRENTAVMAAFLGLEMAKMVRSHYRGTLAHLRSPVDVPRGGGLG